MIRKTILAITLLLLSASIAFAQEIPDRIEYCGITLKLTPGAKVKLKAYINAIYESPRFFNTMVEKADTYMPYIEEAFSDAALPEDLKYLVIQESSLKADAVSDSDAVGYWQFKLDPALEYGLRVDEFVDERQHIFRASQAAAQYFHKANYDFDNWVYAVVAYYEGLTGAVRYTDPVYYGKTEMVITEQLHWYAMKAIAHKLAYQVALEMERAPRVWLEAKASKGEAQIAAICDQNGLPPELFIEYNKWAVNRTVLPKGESLTYYIPHFSEPYPGHKPDPTKKKSLAQASTKTEEPPAQKQEENISSDLPTEQTLAGQEQGKPAENQQLDEDKTDVPPAEMAVKEEAETPEMEPASSKPKRALRGEAMKVSEDPDLDYALFFAKADLNYGEDFILVEAGVSLGQIAKQYKVPLGRLASWNGFRGGQLPEAGSYLYLSKPEKVAFHIVSAGETVNQIAAQHKTSAKAIYKKNRYAKGQRDIYIGQKLYVGGKKPKGEKIIILQADNPFKEKEEVVGIPFTQTNKPEEKPVLKHGPAENTQTHSQPVPPPENPTLPGNQQSPGDEAAEETEQEDLPPRDYSGPKTRWVNHTVSTGETLWSISVTYGTKVEIIKLINKMPNDSLSQGMVLRILAKEDKLKELGIE